MLELENKENDTKTINTITPEKIQVEQKPRRSVLKEFDPFAPESPQLNQINRLAIDEEDTFEDAQTSFTNFFGTKPRNAIAVPVACEGDNASFNMSCLIPELRDYAPTNPNDISDACYVESVENLSGAQDLSTNATHSDEEIEFSLKKCNIKMDRENGTEDPQNMENHQNISNSQSLNAAIEVPKVNESFSVEISDNTEDKLQYTEKDQNMSDLKNLKSTVKVPESDKSKEKHQNTEKNQNITDIKELNSTVKISESDINEEELHKDQNMSNTKNLNLTIEIPNLDQTVEELQNTEKDQNISYSNNLNLTVDPSKQNINEEQQNMDQGPYIPVSQSFNSIVEASKSNESVEVCSEETHGKNDELNNTQKDQNIPDSTALNSTIEVPKINVSFSVEIPIENTETTENLKINDVTSSSVDKLIKADLNSTFDSSKNSTETEVTRNSCNKFPEDIPNEMIKYGNISMKTETSDIKPNKTCIYEDQNIADGKTAIPTDNSTKNGVKEDCFNQTFDTVSKPVSKDDRTSKTTNTVLNRVYTEKQELNSTFEKNPKQDVLDHVKSGMTKLNVTDAEKDEPKDLDETLEALQENGRSDFVNSTMDGPFNSTTHSTKIGNILNETVSVTKQSKLRGTFTNEVISSPNEENLHADDEECESEKEMQSIKELEQMANSLNKTIDVEESAISQEANKSLSPNKSSEELLNKTIEGKIELPAVPVAVDTNINMKKEPVKSSVAQSRLSSRVSCRPSIKSAVKKSDIENCNKIINATPPTTPSIESNPSKSRNSVDEVIKEYKNENAALNSQIMELREEMSKIKSEHERTTKQKQSQKLTKSDEKRKYILLKSYEHMIKKQTQDLLVAKAEYDQCNKMVTKTEMAFSDLFEKYQTSRCVIENFKENEKNLKANLHSAEDQLAKLKARHAALQTRYEEQQSSATEKIEKEKQKQDSEHTKLQAIVKRLEIKISSLETALKQKTEECQALSALCDDITGHP